MIIAQRGEICSEFAVAAQISVVRTVAQASIALPRAPSMRWDVEQVAQRDAVLLSVNWNERNASVCAQGTMRIRLSVHAQKGAAELVGVLYDNILEFKQSRNPLLRVRNSPDTPRALRRKRRLHVW